MLTGTPAMAFPGTVTVKCVAAPAVFVRLKLAFGKTPGVAALTV